jgi:hypothetical protein
MLEVSILRLHGQCPDVSPGWAPHEMLGYGDANTETRYGNVMFSAYMKSICSSSNRDFIKIGNRGNTSISTRPN